MKYIETLREGEKLGDIYLCKSRQSALTKSGKSYENVILQDKTGTLDAKIWDPGSPGIGDFDALDYVYVVGDVTSFQGSCSFPSNAHPGGGGRVRSGGLSSHEPQGHRRDVRRAPEIYEKSQKSVSSEAGGELFRGK